VSACPACGGAEQRPAFTAKDPLGPESFVLVTCLDCGLTFVQPILAPEHIEQYYAKGYYGRRHPALKDFFMNMRVRQVGPPRASGRLLDVGCGGGDFPLAARKRGWQVVGIEQGGAPIMEQQDALGIRVVPPERMHELEAASFEVVTIWHVLEHLPEPRATLESVRRLLAPNGRLVVEVPNFGSWQARLGGPDWFHIDVPRHLLHFDRRALEALLVRAGFVVERRHTFSLEYDAFGLMQTILNKVCRTPNYLFQSLIGRGTERMPHDTFVSAALGVPLAAVSTAVSLAAPVFGQGGVLRMVARPRVT
jgi:2-polyprenyl-3-methyl-5-hydroxy-6-metoxy-1,4-benzoquinol methylase